MKAAAICNFAPGWKAILFALLLLPESACTCSADEGETAAQQAVAGYAKYLSSVRSVSFKSVFKDKFKASENYTNSLAQEWVVDFEGRRMWRRTQKAAIDGIAPDNLRLSEQLKLPTHVSELSLESDSQKVLVMMGYKDAPKDYWDSDAGFLYLAFPFGFLDNDPLQFIPDLLASSSLTTQGDAVVLTGGVAGEYQITVELSPSKNWMPTRIDFQRPETPGKNELVKGSYAVDESRQIDGIWFPVAYHCTTEHSAGTEQLPPGVRVKDGVYTLERDSDGNPSGQFSVDVEAMSLVAEVALEDIKFNQATDDDFKLKASVPNGTKIWLQDARNLDYIWHDGQAVPRTADTRPTTENRR